MSLERRWSAGQVRMEDRRHVVVFTEENGCCEQIFSEEERTCGDALEWRQVDDVLSRRCRLKEVGGFKVQT